MQRGVAVVVDGRDAAAERQRVADGRERLLVRAGTLAHRPDADPRRHHQRRRAVLVRQQRICAQLDQQAHQLDVGRLRREQEGRGADAVQHVAVAVVRLLRHPRVQVCAVRGQRADELQVGRRAGDDGWRVVEAEVRPARPLDLVERGPALVVGVRVRAGVQQVRPELVVAVAGRQDERAGSVEQRLLRTRAGLDEQARHGEMAGPHRERQRAEAARGPRVDVRPAGEQRLRRGQVVLCRRPHQRRLPAPPFRAVRVRAAVEQQPHGVRAAGPGHGQQGGLALRGRRVGVGAGVQQQLDERGAAVLGGQGQRRRVEAVGRLGAGAGRDQRPARFDVVAERGPVQRRRAVAVGRVDVDAVRDQRAGAPGVAGPQRVDEGQVDRRRPDA